MPNIKRVETDIAHCCLVEVLSGVQYRERPFENYSKLPYYDYEIETRYTLFVFSVDNTDQEIYKIGGFSARPINEESGWLKWESLNAAFKEALPLLDMFLNFRCKNQSKNSELNIENNVEIKTFKEEQLEAVELHLTGHAHFELLTACVLFKLFDVNSIPSVKKEALRRIEANITLPEETESINWGFFDMEEWIEESQEQSFHENLEDLREHWLIPNAPMDKIYNETIGQYLSGEQKLPDQDAYAKKHLTDILPYLRLAS